MKSKGRPPKNLQKSSSKPRSPAHWHAAAHPIAMKNFRRHEHSTKAISSSRLPDTGLRIPRNPDAHRTFRRLFCHTGPPPLIQ
ncbi:hypothetical protein TNCV_3447461 [Trichonephila clavipes]|nr:hypothetical protein TNCV_3447461 [Trichonephila clavipes]